MLVGLFVSKYVIVGYEYFSMSDMGSVIVSSVCSGSMCVVCVVINMVIVIVRGRIGLFVSDR